MKGQAKIFKVWESEAEQSLQAQQQQQPALPTLEDGRLDDGAPGEAIITAFSTCCSDRLKSNLIITHPNALNST